MNIETASLLVSLVALLMSTWILRQQFRPIVTATVKTVKAGNTAICYSLKIMNSGSIPARNIKLSLNEHNLMQLLGEDASEENKEKWIYSINKNSIYILQNGESTSCSFGCTRENNTGFWKYGSEFPVVISYEGWLGIKHSETQLLKIQDSDSFTGYMWD
ncbi:hypothetical protein JD491_00095 [Aeromonas caviae]|uniref:hypothetical protein n=1 Tax=Aeromonas caviae TaxID=648 RepID=UPI0019204E80|nr:hypothetical protein [Aeromonas caviae]MBL0576047.1 hypothetical protein [Aeromonas caviae]